MAMSTREHDAIARLAASLFFQPAAT